MSLLLGLTLLLTFVALGELKEVVKVLFLSDGCFCHTPFKQIDFPLGYTESCGYLIRNHTDGSTTALINGSISVNIEQGGHNVS